MSESDPAGAVVSEGSDEAARGSAAARTIVISDGSMGANLNNEPVANDDEPDFDCLSSASLARS